MANSPIRKCGLPHCSNEVRVTAQATAQWGPHPPCYNCRSNYRYWWKAGGEAMAARNIYLARAGERLSFARRSKPK